MAWRGGGLIRPVQVAVIPEAAYEEEETPDRTLSGGQGARAHPCWKTPPASLGCCEAGKRREGGRVKSPQPVPGPLCLVLAFFFNFFKPESTAQVQGVVALELVTTLEEGVGGAPGFRTLCGDGGSFGSGWGGGRTQNPSLCCHSMLYKLWCSCLRGCGHTFTGSIPSQENPTKAFISSQAQESLKWREPA